MGRIEPGPGNVLLFQCAGALYALVHIPHHVVIRLIEVLGKVIVTTGSNHIVVGKELFEVSGFHAIVLRSGWIISISFTILIPDCSNFLNCADNIF